MLIITVTITSIIIGASFIRPWWASCHINESFVFVVKVSCCFSLVSSPVTRHLAAAPSNDQPAHCNDSQPASRHTHTHTHTHTNRQNTLNLWFQTPQRDTLQYFSPLPRRPYWTVFMPFLRRSSRSLISSSLPSLDVCAVWQKTHFLSSPRSFHLCLIPSFLVVCHGEITETGTINRRPGRVLLPF